MAPVFLWSGRPRFRQTLSDANAYHVRVAEKLREGMQRSVVGQTKLRIF